jgi:hypothetical protein
MEGLSLCVSWRGYRPDVTERNGALGRTLPRLRRAPRSVQIDKFGARGRPILYLEAEITGWDFPRGGGGSDPCFQQPTLACSERITKLRS